MKTLVISIKWGNVGYTTKLKSLQKIIQPCVPTQENPRHAIPRPFSRVDTQD